jgi:hypothetical protein
MMVLGVGIGDSASHYGPWDAPIFFKLRHIFPLARLQLRTTPRPPLDDRTISRRLCHAHCHRYLDELATGREAVQA